VGNQPEKRPKTERLGFRADPELAARVNDLIEAMQRSARMKGLDVNMTVALKMLVRRALPLAELEYMGKMAGMTKEQEKEFLLSEFRQLFLALLPRVEHEDLAEALDEARGTLFLPERTQKRRP
jgi:hypothetical protein